jgi:DNA polymerase III alpha subunit (gram-positive type)
MISPVQNIIVFDLETTGLKPDKNSLIEIACCPIDKDLKDLEEFDSGIIAVYDNREVTEGALKANGITRDQIENGLDPQKVADKLVAYLKKMKVGRSKPVLAGHNIVKFDLPFLEDFLRVHGHDLFKYVNKDHFFDTMWRARERWGELQNFKLGTCCEEAGVELIDAHRAINDTRANKDLVKYLLRNLRNDSTGSKEETYKRPVFQF